MTSFITEVGLALFSIVTLTLGVATHPARFTCPIGMYLSHGVSRDGRAVCERVLVGNENNAYQPAGALYGRVYCTGGTVPIVVSDRVAGCQRYSGM